MAVIAFIFRDKLGFIADAFDALGRADPGPVAAALACAVASILAMAAVMELLLNVERRVTGIWPCTAITLASNSWSTTLPGGPAFSAWLTYRVQRSWGATEGVCGWFFVLSGALSTVWLILIGVATALLFGAQLSPAALAASLATALLSMAALWWATGHPGRLRRWAALAPERARAKLVEVIDQVARIRMTRTRFTLTAMYSLLNRLFDLSVFWLCCLAIVPSAPLGAVTLAFIITKLAGSAQVTPGGVGTVESIAAASLVASGFSLVDATAATLIYRAISFAFITAAGWVVYFVAYAGRGLMLRP
ncbi:TIGR00374 family protein [Corynebacterium liangguodongii]|uniref:TIGR00374 family protein n=2 Tax=Corynebacterium liangguodongii TaxID=2079535 RepID=A0A2S0WHG0_9CORY|nr:TIGR00374 family protein [Corynebacterium liangguodongii]PWB99252.1 UPF0104 family protein [Corynebacterium liangguodongii]